MTRRVIYIGPDEVKAMAQSYKDGATVRQLAKIHNIGTTKVLQILHGAGADMRPCGQRPDLDRARAVLEMHKNGATYREIARILGMATSRAWAIAKTGRDFEDNENA